LLPADATNSQKERELSLRMDFESDLTEFADSTLSA
jgi:hypothetical protein